MSTSEVKRVTDEVLAKIVTGAYPPGVRLPSELMLASEFGCGRSTIRESLRHLDTMGVVKSRRGSGAVVLDYRREGRSMDLLVPWLTSGEVALPLEVLVRELLATRTQMICHNVQIAARYASPEALDPARRLVDVSRTLEDDPLAHAINDVELHRTIAAASRMWPAVWLFNAIQSPLVEISRRFPAFALVPEQYASRMTDLLDLIVARDADAAAELLTTHLADVDRAILGALAGGN